MAISAKKQVAEQTVAQAAAATDERVASGNAYRKPSTLDMPAIKVSKAGTGGGYKSNISFKREGFTVVKLSPQLALVAYGYYHYIAANGIEDGSFVSVATLNDYIIINKEPNKDGSFNYTWMDYSIEPEPKAYKRLYVQDIGPCLNPSDDTGKLRLNLIADIK
jgi:hypothetical protein